MEPVTDAEYHDSQNQVEQINTFPSKVTKKYSPLCNLLFGMAGNCCFDAFVVLGS